MQVKCRYCKKLVEKKEAYKDPNKNFYYCNEEHYLTAIKKKEEKEKAIEEQKIIKAERKAKRDAVYNELCDILGYEVQNSMLFAEWVLWNKLADDEKILAYLQENKDYIKNKINNLRDKEYDRIRYMSAILKNSLKDYSNRGKRAQMSVVDDAMPKESSFILFEPVKENKKTRKSFAELEDDL